MTDGTWFRSVVPDDEPAPRDFDTSVAHPARIWDYWLGGKDNFAADRAAAEKVLEVSPVVARIARADRAFLAQVVQYLVAEAGIRQFLDIGTGLPTANNTHEVAQRAAPQSRIVYVDNDPIVLAHARALLTSDPRGATAYIDADLRDVDAILTQAARTLDLSEPVAVMLLAVLHFIPDAEDPYAITARLMDALPSGSYLALTHAAAGESETDPVTEGAGRYNEHSSVPLTFRTREEVAAFFGGLELVGPGIVPLGRWHPPGTAAPDGQQGLPGYAALGRKP
ncbi:MAG TPA: SAM-dependent methyltransferase [Streptosporangiaceae bacterium]|nr:SAM-dependent methyltransferase [Streptosporangiaceae bacterium]